MYKSLHLVPYNLADTMKYLCVWALILVLVTDVTSFDGKKVNTLPKKTAEELKNLLDYKILVPDCTNIPQVKPQYLLYSRGNSDKPVQLTSKNLNLVKSGKNTTVIIPGWLSSPTTSYIQSLKNAYLKKYDNNIIIIDWSQLSFQPYTEIYCAVPRLALEASKFFCQLSRVQEIPINQIHIIGHSLGAQIAGFIGKNTDLQCNQRVGRITGLDPSGPIYKTLDQKRRLSKIDALHVDVIHTDSKLGIYGNSGHVDFHANCANEQPGCPVIFDVSGDHLISDCLCGSVRSIEYMIESVHSKQLIAVSCSLCPGFCEPDYFTEVYTFMGDDCRKTPAEADNFLIFTRSKSPYGMGMLPYENITLFK